MSNNIIPDRIPPLVPADSRDLFFKGGTVYDAIHILWKKLQEMIVANNHALDVIDRQLAINDLSAIDAKNNGEYAKKVIKKIAEELKAQLGVELDIDTLAEEDVDDIFNNL